MGCAAWFRSPQTRWRALRHLRNRARLNVAMLDELDLINRTAELAKTFGIDFYSVISRGSQYRVESMLARLAHTQNLLLVRLQPSMHRVTAGRHIRAKRRLKHICACPADPACKHGCSCPADLPDQRAGGSPARNGGNAASHGARELLLSRPDPRARLPEPLPFDCHSVQPLLLHMPG
jgi:hypothetical protein